MEEKTTLSGTDALAITAHDGRGAYNYPVVPYYNNNGGDFFGGNGGAFWIFALLLLNNGGIGGGRGGRFDGVSEGELAASQNAQTNQLTLSNIQSQISENKYDVAQAIQLQTSELMQQNNTNLINAIQGFNNLGSQITNQTNTLSMQIQQLGAQMNECCCDIKTQMLQDRLDEAERRNVTLENSINNANQSQYILSQLGRFVAWTGTGTAGAVAGAAS